MHQKYNSVPSLYIYWVVTGIAECNAFTYKGLRSVFLCSSVYNGNCWRWLACCWQMPEDHVQNLWEKQIGMFPLSCLPILFELHIKWVFVLLGWVYAVSICGCKLETVEDYNINMNLDTHGCGKQSSACSLRLSCVQLCTSVSDERVTLIAYLWMGFL